MTCMERTTHQVHLPPNYALVNITINTVRDQCRCPQLRQLNLTNTRVRCTPCLQAVHQNVVSHVRAVCYLHKAKFRSNDFGCKREETNPSSNCWSNTLSTRPPYTLWPSSARRASHGTYQPGKSGAGQPRAAHEQNASMKLTSYVRFSASTKTNQHHAHDENGCMRCGNRRSPRTQPCTVSGCRP